MVNLIQLGQHRLYCADALQTENYKTILGEATADIVLPTLHTMLKLVEM